MNKETIKKFKNEFDWWINRDKIWEKLDEKQCPWILTECPKFDKDYIYAISDKHAIERKAFAEGKEIECKQFDMMWYSVDEPRWDGKYGYRIKPEPWYLHIPEMGLLCWVSNSDEKPDITNDIDIIICYDIKLYRKFVSRKTEWLYAKPLTIAETTQLLPGGLK